ncbi:Putative G-patch domain, RNA recognition motif domain, RNA-binding domain superfamily [Septoria linicola]|uniref:G-patch domain, RNA recognition motif domain, RNA-binding domain superfamily n=1 Tax=Septoria linicola TaxID=215465 RepID=A0A9Q9B5Z1_9PEZI|nr:Putative G-patch domain, RNA recognition motif domain, RNA-binding domain superfamily [Septoria linicola]
MAEPPAKKGRLTLYEDLLSKESIAAMQAKDAEKQAAQQAKKAKDAALMFKPTNIGNKKPLSKTSKKPAPNFSAMHKFPSSASTSSTGPAPEASSSSSSDAPLPAPPQAGPKLTQTRGFNDWLANDEEMDWVYDRQQQSKEQRKASRKKNKKNKYEPKVRSFDDIYDPTVPVPIAEYKGSDAEFETREDWKRRLAMAKKRQDRLDGKDVDMDDSDKEDTYRPRMGMQFAPPSSFAGPSSPRRDTSDDREEDMEEVTYAPPPPAADVSMEETADEVYARRMAMATTSASPAPAPPPPPAARHAPPTYAPASAPPPVISKPKLSAADEEKKAKVAAQIAAMKAKMAAKSTPAVPQNQPAQTQPSPPVAVFQPATQQVQTTSPAPALPGVQSTLTAPKYDAAWLATPSEAPFPIAGTSSRPSSSGTISGAPTFNPRYTAARLPQNADTTPSGTVSGAPSYNPQWLAQQQQELSFGTPMPQPAQQQQGPEERTTRPGQDGFAERLMKKLGWEKGQGLGASGEGITTALRMQAEKRKKKSDAQGGGYVAPAAMGKIVGGKKAKPKPGEETAGGELDQMTEVVKLSGMLENMDVDHAIREEGLLQEIGTEMGEYGTVERIYIFRKADGGEDDVFVKFTSPWSARKCLKAMDGAEFVENKVAAAFFDAEKFERGEYTSP